jgi:predicted PurR-regulated permease PerM
MMKKRLSQGGVSQFFNLSQSQVFLFILLLFSFFGCYLMLRPYLNAIMLALILSTLLYPVNKRIKKWLNGRKNLAAFLTCVLLVLLVMLPLTFVLFALIQQGYQSITAISDWIASGKYQDLINHPWAQKAIVLGDKYLPDAQKLFPDLDIQSINLQTLNIDKILLEFGKILLNQGGSFFGNIAALVAQSFLMLFSLFFLVRDQESIFRTALHLIPLSASHERKIIEKVTAVARSAILGTLITAAAQGTAGGIAFKIAGLPALFWGAMMSFSSLIPFVGTSLIWLPASIYLFLSGRWKYGIFMVLWSVLIVGMIDNFIRPLFMKESGSGMSTLVIFFAILGGLSYFGLIGLLYGPLIVGITLVLLYIYSLEFNSLLKQLDRS